MNIPSNALWVFDLDDTLYKEKDYQTSGFCAIKKLVQISFGVNIDHIIENAQANKKDVFEEICEYLQVPTTVKESLLWCYRLHSPSIKLDHMTCDTLNFIKNNSIGIAIITDGRSISQRKKVKALGLNEYDLYISEEWGEVKPGEIRFNEIVNNNPSVSTFIYVGDNIKKDFVTPNKLLDWITVGLKDNGENIHSQLTDSVDPHFLPDIWINSLDELKGFIC